MNQVLTGSEANLVAYYPMENGSGSTIASDFAGGNNNGTLINMVASSAWVTRNITLCAQQMTVTPTVSITPAVSVPVFAAGATSTRCQGVEAITYDASASDNTGITYTLDLTSRTAGNTINASTGLVNWVTGWSGSSTITATATGCSGPKSSTHTVTTTATVGTPSFTLGSSSVRCQASGNVTYTASATNSTGIVYSLDAASLAAGNTIVSSTGRVTYLSGWTGTSVITAVASGCNGPKSATHTVTTTPTVGTPVFAAGASSTRCQAAGTITYSATATDNTGITYSLDLISRTFGNTINSATGAVTFLSGWFGTSTITASAAGCNGPATSNHVVTVTGSVGTPTFTLGSTSTRCQGAGAVNYDASASNSTGITYSLSAASLSAGNTIDAATGIVTYVAGFSGTSVVTASAAGCSGPKTASHTVTVTPTVSTPVFSFGASTTRCQAGGSVTYTATASNSTSITYSLDAATLSGGNTFNTSTGRVTYVLGWSGTSIITASAAGCNGPATATHTVTTTPLVGTPVYAMGASSTRCQGDQTITYTATATDMDGISYALDGTSRANGNTINAATGAVTFVAGWTGTSTITATATGCANIASANHTVTTTPTVGTPVFTLGAASPVCQASAPVTYTATATNSTGITYSLDAASISAGNSIAAGTGRVTFAAAFAGTITVTATASGCNGPSTASHTITVNPTVGATSFIIGSTSSRCQSYATITYTATAVNTTGIVYSLDAYSLSQGNIINSSTGLATWSSSFSGTAVITATANGCNGPTSATHTVTITSIVSTPVFDLGASSSRCIGAGTIVYNATASNATSMTYSLDGASLSAGNTINSATGSVTFTAAWSGTSRITATATGCNGSDFLGSYRYDQPAGNNTCVCQGGNLQPLPDSRNHYLFCNCQ